MHPEYGGGSIFVRNVGNHVHDYTVSQLRTRNDLLGLNPKLVKLVFVWQEVH